MTGDNEPWNNGGYADQYDANGDGSVSFDEWANGNNEGIMESLSSGNWDPMGLDLTPLETMPEPSFDLDKIDWSKFEDWFSGLFSTTRVRTEVVRIVRVTTRLRSHRRGSDWACIAPCISHCCSAYKRYRGRKPSLRVQRSA